MLRRDYTPCLSKSCPVMIQARTIRTNREQLKDLGFPDSEAAFNARRCFAHFALFRANDPRCRDALAPDWAARS